MKTFGMKCTDKPCRPVRGTKYIYCANCKVIIASLN